MDAGDGEVQRDLLVGLEGKVGKVERVAIDAVAVLLVPSQSLRENRDTLVAQQPLVALESLTPRRVLDRIAGHLVGDGVERQGLRGVQEHQDEVRDAFQPIELRGRLHRPEPTADTGA